MEARRLIFHIDVNSAFLSWESVYRLSLNPDAQDLRLIPSAVGGDVSSRHGIILAKSTPAKKSGVVTPETICSLEEGKIDFGVVTTPFSCKSTIHSMMVKPIGTVFIAGDSFGELKGKKLDYSILGSMPCIFLEKNTSTRAFMDAFLSAKGMELTPEFELATSDMIVQFAKRNMGVGCVMDGFAKDAIAKGEVFELDFKEKMPLRHICVVTGENSLISLAGRKLLNLFDEMAESS